MIFESFFGVFASNAMEFSIEKIKSSTGYISAPKLVKKDLDSICTALENKDITNDMKVLLLIEMACYTENADKYINSLIIEATVAEAKQKADLYDKRYGELVKWINSKEERLGEFQEALGESKNSNKNYIQCNIDEFLKLSKNVKTEMKAYDTTKQDNQIVTVDILRKKYRIIKDIEKSVANLWSEYKIILIEMSNLNAECDSNSIKNMLGGLKAGIETLKNYCSSKINDTSHTTKE